MKKLEKSLLVFLIICATYFFIFKITEFIAVDKRLDSGCAWNSASKECDCLKKQSFRLNLYG